MTGKELHYIADAHARGHLSEGGYYTMKCNEWMKSVAGTRRALLTQSCTAALEIASMLLNIEPGDEVIMPSYTFVSTANAFVLGGGVPVFVDIRSDTLNIDESLIESAISEKTKAIVPVHYAGIGCQMEVIMELASESGVKVVEDAAQAVQSTYKGRPLGGGSAILEHTLFMKPKILFQEKGEDFLSITHCMKSVLKLLKRREQTGQVLCEEKPISIHGSIKGLLILLEKL